MIFQNREDAGQRLGQKLKRISLKDPLVLGIPRGGVVTGAALAQVISAEFDIILAHKLRCPWQPEFAIGAVGEDGRPLVDADLIRQMKISDVVLKQECQRQISEINRRKRLFREIRPAATLSGRTVIVTDDGIATGSTMSAALEVARGQNPHDVIVAVPVAPRDHLETIRKKCDQFVCLHIPEIFYAVGEFYRSFEAITDSEVVEILREFAPSSNAS